VPGAPVLGAKVLGAECPGAGCFVLSGATRLLLPPAATAPASKKADLKKGFVA